MIYFLEKCYNGTNGMSSNFHSGAFDWDPFDFVSILLFIVRHILSLSVAMTCVS